ncbi:MAG: hypothetical protein K2G60_02560 [Oscillospiraceae bacterium]|nr:hypothetical protein [Oscillospiraceae bacterium]
MNSFSALDDVKLCNKTVQSLIEILLHLEREICNGNTNVAHVWAKDLIKSSEKICKISRTLPLKFGGEFVNGRDKYEDVKDQISSAWDIKIGYIQDKWLCIRLPILAPKIQGHTSDIFYEPLNLSLEKFFRDNMFTDKRAMVICYRFVYNKDIPHSRYHDHDNKEVKMITDAITNLTLVDDSPKHLNHYYCSAIGKESHTEVFLVPREELSEWLVYENTITEKGAVFPV